MMMNFLRGLVVLSFGFAVQAEAAKKCTYELRINSQEVKTFKASHTGRSGPNQMACNWAEKKCENYRAEHGIEDFSCLRSGRYLAPHRRDQLKAFCTDWRFVGSQAFCAKGEDEYLLNKRQQFDRYVESLCRDSQECADTCFDIYDRDHAGVDC